MKESSQVQEEVKSAPSSDYYNFPIPLFFVAVVSATLDSAGNFFWFWLRWKSVKQSEKTSVWPFWRGFFSIIFCYALFKKTLHIAKTHGYDKSYSPALLAVIYIILSLLSIFMLAVKNYPGNDTQEVRIATAFVSLFTVLPLIPVQEAINYTFSKMTISPTQKRFTKIGRVAFPLLAVLLVAFYIYTLPPSRGWQEFRSPQGDFTVSFPVTPVHKTEELPAEDFILVVNSYEGKTPDGMQYVVKSITLPENSDDFTLPQAELVLRNGLELILKGTNAQLLSSQFKEIQGRRELEYLARASIKSKKGEVTVYIKGLLLLSGSKLYSVSAIYAEKLYNQADYDRFISSFTLQ